jgi:two-component system, OmpR family, response regulator
MTISGDSSYRIAGESRASDHETTTVEKQQPSPWVMISERRFWKKDASSQNDCGQKNMGMSNAVFQRERILIVEDDEKIVSILKDALELEGFFVDGAGDGEIMKRELESQEFSLMLLDIGLPGRSGIELVREARYLTNAPIIFVSGRSTDIDRIVGLEVGADDYIVKPFNVREVVARVRAVLRRSQDRGRNGDVRASPGALRFRLGDIWVNRQTRQLTAPGKPTTALTTAEFELLEFLYKNAGKICSRDEITAALRGHEWSPLDRSLDTLVARIRKKIEVDPDMPTALVTIRGTGYRLNLGP